MNANQHRPWPSPSVVQAALELALARQPVVTEDDQPNERHRRPVTEAEVRGDPPHIDRRRGRISMVRWDWWWILAESGRYSISGIAARTGGWNHASVLYGLNRMAGHHRSWRSGCPAPGDHAPLLAARGGRIIAVQRVEYGAMP